jgi:hypothetical protein
VDEGKGVGDDNTGVAVGGDTTESTGFWVGSPEEIIGFTVGVSMLVGESVSLESDAGLEVGTGILLLVGAAVALLVVTCAVGAAVVALLLAASVGALLVVTCAVGAAVVALLVAASVGALLVLA